MKKVLKYLGENFGENTSSNGTGSTIHQMIKKETNCYDPYITEKKAGNEIALNLIPKVREILKEDNSLESYVKIAIVGNILDFGAFELDTDIESLIFEGLHKDLVINEIASLEEDLIKYDKVLYLVDNTGEVVFDKLLLEKIKTYDIDITVAVKEKPILNDACMEDAIEAGLDEVATLMTTGVDSVGIVESMISSDFKEYFYNSPFVISKGMGNYEGLTEMNLEGQEVFTLLCTKCSAISKNLGVAEGSHILSKL